MAEASLANTMTKLYVGSLPEGADNASLEAMFAKYGKVEECDIVKNYAFVHMATDEEAKAAVDGLHNAEYMGAKITVEVSHSKVRQKPGMGGRGQCYRCGKQGHWSKECPRNPNARFGGPMLPPGGPMGRYGAPAERVGAYGERFVDRGPYGPAGDRAGYGAAYADRMRPYPDPYERRPPPGPRSAEDFYYYRRPYEDFGASYYASQEGAAAATAAAAAAAAAAQTYSNGYSYSADRTYPPSASRTPAF